MEKIGLAETIDALRAELIDAVARAANEDIQFPVGSVQVEFQVGVTKATEAKSGVKLWVLEVGAGGTYASESVQKVTVTLEQPVDRDGTPIKVARASGYKP